MPQEPVKPTPIKTESPMKPKAPKAPAPVAAPAAPMEIDDSLLPIADMLVSDVAQDIWRQTGRDPSMKQVLAAIAKHPLLKK